MHIITNITIRNFRSISSAQISVPSGYLPIVGANNSGKSNILRALNLYFNSETEPGRLLNIKEDFHNPSRKKKKEICLAIEFHLPEHFNFQKTIRAKLDDLLGRDFVIEKRWSIPESPIEKEAKLSVYYRKGSNSFKLAESIEEYHIRQFLSLIRFRYLPNHIHPSEMLRKEQNSIQTELLAKLRRSKKVSLESQEDIFEELGNLSKEFILPVAKVLHGAAPDIEAIDLSTPKDLGELLFSFAPQLKVSGGETFNALLHGSGVQSLLTLLILRYLDSQFYSRFGWHQATIWAIEEPESFLHQDLEHKVASILSETGKPADSRFQIFCTTHSNVFVRYATKGLICSLKNGRTDAEPKDARSLVGEASKLGISSYVPPIIFGAQRPLLIVEGESDKLLIEYAYAALKITCPWEIQDIKTITSGSYEGVDGLKTYLKAVQDILGSRSLKSPIFILIDWNESNNKLEDINSLLRVHGTSKAIRWDADNVNPHLDRTFTGIERFLSIEVILAASDERILVVSRPMEDAYPLLVDRHNIKKKALAELVINRGQSADVNHFRNQLEDLNKKLVESHRNALNSLSGTLFTE
jgi:predicted ATP-dependent endonuclease of OLD family